MAPQAAGRTATPDALLARWAGERTNMPDSGLRTRTDSSLHGLTRDPWATAGTADGSSGGEGSATHACGIASIEPTSGVAPDARSTEPLGGDTDTWGRRLMPDVRVMRPVLEPVTGAEGLRSLDLVDPLHPQSTTQTW